MEWTGRACDDAIPPPERFLAVGLRATGHSRASSLSASPKASAAFDVPLSAIPQAEKERRKRVRSLVGLATPPLFSGGNDLSPIQRMPTVGGDL